MVKRSPYLDKMLAGTKRIPIDQNAVSIVELRKELDCGHAYASRFANEHVDSGEWERVQKRLGNRLIPAYRMKKK